MTHDQRMIDGRAAFVAELKRQADADGASTPYVAQDFGPSKIIIDGEIDINLALDAFWRGYHT